MTVYHYCSIDTFTNIISGNNIRLSDITKSNDSMEILWITNFIKDIFDEEFEKEKHNTLYFGREYEKSVFNELVERYSVEFFEEDIRLYSYFVCCFSENGDLLSQWRGYADDANGLSIGFDSHILSRLGLPSEDDFISDNYFEYGEINYLENRQKGDIRKIAKQLLANLKVLAKEKPKDIKKESMSAFNNCFLQLFKISIFMKNPFFKEEKEWRLSHLTQIEPDFINYANNEIEVSDIKFYPRKNDFVPYITLNFNKIKNQLIKEVIIGPKCRARLSDIKTFLDQSGFHCEVKPSKGTYR